MLLHIPFSNYMTKVSILSLFLSAVQGSSGLDELMNRGSLVELLSTMDGKAAVRGSGDRRRIWGNNKNACEASGDSDAANTDCYAKRWGMLNDYWPLHSALKRDDRALVLTEWAIEGIMGQAMNNLGVATDIVVGNDGSLAKPSLTNGLIFESTLLKNATAQLQRASIASVDALYSTLLNVTETAINDTSQLKIHIAASYGDLMSKVKDVAETQSQRAGNNTATMVGDASAALKSTVNSVTAKQQGVVGAVANGTAINTAGSTGFASTSTKLSAALSDADDLVDSGADSLSATTAKAAATVSESVATAATAVTDAATEQASTISSHGGDLVASFSDQTAQSIADAKADLAAATSTVTATAEAHVAAAGEKVDNLNDHLVTLVGGLQDTISGDISSTADNLAAKAAAADKSNADLSAGATQVANTIAAGTDAAKSTASATATTAEATAAESKKNLQALILATSQTSGKSVSSIIAALGGAQADAQASTAQTAAEQQEAINQFLAQIGNDNTHVAGVMSNLQSMVASGTSSTEASIAAAIAGAKGTTSATGTAIAGQLDAASASLSESERSFAAASSSASSNLKDAVAGGSAATAAALAGLNQNNGQVAYELQQNMIGAMSGFEGNAEDLKNRLADLTHALESEGAEGASTKLAAQSISDQGDDALAAALFGVSDSDDDVAASIAAEVKAQQRGLNQVGAAMAGASSNEVQKLWTDISAQLAAKSGQNDKIASQSAASETKAMAGVAGVAGQAASLSVSTDNMIADKKAKSDLALAEFNTQLSNMGAKDNTLVTTLQGKLSGYAGDAMSDVSTYLTALLNSESKVIASNVTSGDAQLSALAAQSTASGAQAEKMNALVAALSKNADTDRNALIGGILKMLDTMDKATSSFGLQINNVQDKFLNVKSASAKGLADLLNSVQNEVLKIPQILTSGAVRLQNDFSLASSDLENNILKLKEKLATAQTDEEKEEALQGLIVLNKMQGLQQGVQDADAKLRTQIAAGAQAGQVSSSNVEGAMVGVLAAMSSINSQMDQSRVTVQSNVQDLGKQTATLVNGLGILVNQTADQLGNDAASAAVAARFNLNMAQARSKVRAAAATQGVNRTLGTFTSNSESALTNEADVQSNIASLSATAKSSSAALGSRIDSVLSSVLGASTKIQSDSSVNENDILTRLALVRMAMAQFLGLWNEYASTMDRKLKRLHSTDSEFISQMEREIKGKLSGAEQSVKATVTRLGALRKDIELSMQEEIEYENMFSTKIMETRASLKDLNAVHQSNTIDSGKSLAEFSNFETSNTANLKDKIKSMIDRFDVAVSDRVTQVGLTPEISA